MTTRRLRIVWGVLASAVIANVACGTAESSGVSGPGGAPSPEGGVTATADGSSGTSSGGTDAAGSRSAAALALRLRGKAQFLIGMGNDLAPDHNQDGAYTLGTPLDFHYAYLVGLPGAGGWPDWNAPSGAFVDVLAASADAHGQTPMGS
jgi:hypothetical protein